MLPFQSFMHNFRILPMITNARTIIPFNACLLAAVVDGSQRLVELVSIG